MKNQFDLTGRTALVTGSSRGIGKAIAFALGDAGAKVLLHGSRESTALEDAGREAAARGISCRLVTGNLCDSAETLALAASCTEPVDILVLNASVQKYMTLAEFDAAEFEREMNANVRSSYQLLQHFLPGMQARKWGRVIALGSVNQERPAARFSVYSATKAALHNLMLNIAKEYAVDGITANTIVPGIIATDRNQAALADPQRVPALLNLVPARRFGLAEDCAQTAVLLASDGASYLTGASIPIAGGMQL